MDAREEAWYGYLAIANSTTIADGFGIDVGGGSVQVMRLAERGLAEAESLPLGAVRVSEAFLPDEKATAKQVKALRRHVGPRLERRSTGGTARAARLARDRRHDPQPGRGLREKRSATRTSTSAATCSERDAPRGADRGAGVTARVEARRACAASSPTAAT